MEDLDLNFDFDFEDLDIDTEYVKVDVRGLIKKLKSKSKHLFKIGKEIKQIDALIDGKIPSKGECYKMVSVAGGFSSLGIIKYIADNEGIEEMYASTFRIGEKHIDILDKLGDEGKIKKCTFVVADQQQYVDKEYGYWDKVKAVCKKHKWKIIILNNHSKLILMKTPKNYHVVETSSNLNENPKMEHFNWENDKEVFEFYREIFEELSKSY